MTDPASDLRSLKRDLRQTMDMRRAVAFARNPDAARALCDHFLKAIQLPAKGIVASYYARSHEMNPAPLTDQLRVRGFEIALPVITGKGKSLDFRLYKDGDKLAPGIMNIPEPHADAPAVDPDILLVPLLAFDRHGHRLGYGGGYYDCTLADLRRRKSILAFGIAFAGQEIPEVPVGPRDARLDKIVTEIQIFSINGALS